MFTTLPRSLIREMLEETIDRATREGLFIVPVMHAVGYWKLMLRRVDCDFSHTWGIHGCANSVALSPKLVLIFDIFKVNICYT